MAGARPSIEPRAADAATRTRHLAACAACRAQYDVSDLEVGSRFHCACGAVVQVTPARPHEAAVVRCSACGGPRQDGVTACGFCGSDFTLHERDLHTICPGCTARISERARFCHGCGLIISPVGAAHEATQKACPACVEERRLTSRELGGPGVTVLECHQCAGLWLGAEAFRLVEGRARELQGTQPGEPGRGESEKGSGPGGGERIYRPCPDCEKLMHRRNYGRRSGVIIDQCAAHGLWFDHGELASILRWIRDGGLRRSDELEALKRREETRSRTPSAPMGPLFESPPATAGKGSLIRGILDFLSYFS